MELWLINQVFYGMSRGDPRCPGLSFARSAQSTWSHRACHSWREKSPSLGPWFKRKLLAEALKPSFLTPKYRGCPMVSLKFSHHPILEDRGHLVLHHGFSSQSTIINRTHRPVAYQRSQGPNTTPSLYRGAQTWVSTLFPGNALLLQRLTASDPPPYHASWCPWFKIWSPTTQDPPKLEAPNDHLPKSLTFHKISWWLNRPPPLRWAAPRNLPLGSFDVHELWGLITSWLRMKF